MAKPGWGAIELAYRAGVLSLRDIDDEYSVTEGAVRKRAERFDWVRKASMQVRKSDMRSGTQESKAHASEKPASASRIQKNTRPKAEPPPDTKSIRGAHTGPPINPFQPGNQQALKHGGCARRLLFKGEVIEDAKALTLEDELFRLQANNLVAAENIGRWLTKLKDTGGNQERRALMKDVGAAREAMTCNTVRTESIAGTLVTVGKMLTDTDYRKVTAGRVSLEADHLRRDAGIDDSNRECDLNDFYSDVQIDAESGPA